MDNWHHIILAAVVLCSVQKGVFLQPDWSETGIFEEDEYFDCNNNTLTSVPDDLPGNITVLYFNYNSLSVLGNKELFNKGLANVRDLHLRFNDIAHLEDEAFSGLSNLSFLSLFANKITVFNVNIFSDNLNMKDLDFGGNPLELPETGPLLNSLSLTKLSLSTCNLTRIPRELFSGTPNLKNLNLNFNRLTTVDLWIVNMLQLLIHFDLEDNAIQHFTCEPDMVVELNEFYNVKLQLESNKRSPSNIIFTESAKYISLVEKPLECDCCMSVMIYAMKKLYVMGPCQVLEGIGRDIGAAEQLEQCYVTYTAEYNRTVESNII